MHSALLQHYSTHTSSVTLDFYDSVIKGRPASCTQGPLNEPRFKEIWAVAVSAEIGERPQKDMEKIASNSRPSVVHGLSRVKSPWMTDSLVERRSRRVSWNVQPARGSLGQIGWTHWPTSLGLEYEWKGPFPDHH